MTVGPDMMSPWITLSPGYLQAFHPLPSSGTLYIPYLRAEAEAGRRVLLDASAARELETSAARILGEVDRYWQSLPSDQRRTPHPLPGLGEWRLEKTHTGMAVFAKGSRHIEILCRDWEARRYGFAWRTTQTEAYVRVSTQTNPHEIFTDLYFFRKRFPVFAKAVAFAGYFSALIYASGQYQEEELGALTLKIRESAEERHIDHKRLPELKLNDLQPEGEVVFASERSVFDTTPGGYREAIASASVTAAPEGGHDVAVTLYRPHSRPHTRMALAPRLAKIWNHLQYKIQS